MSNGRYTVGNDNGIQFFTPIKGIMSNGGNTIRNRNAGKTVKVFKSRITDSGNAFFNYNFCDWFIIIIPRSK